MENDKKETWDTALENMAQNMPNKPILMAWVDDAGSVKSAIGASPVADLLIMKHMINKRINEVLDSGMNQK